MSKQETHLSLFAKAIAVFLVLAPLLTYAWGSFRFEQRLDNQARTLNQLGVLLRDKVPDAIARGINRGHRQTRGIARQAARREIRKVTRVKGVFTGRPCFGKSITLRDNRPVIFGTAGEDVIRSGQGDQTIFSLGGYDRVCSGRGRDDIDAENPFDPSSDYDRADGGRGRDSCEAELRKRCEE